MEVFYIRTEKQHSRRIEGTNEKRANNKTHSVHAYTKIITYVHGYISKKINFKPHARAYQQVHGYRNTGCNTYKYTGTHRTDGIHILCTGIHTKYTGTATRVAPNLARAHIDPFLIPSPETVAQATTSHEKKIFFVHGHQPTSLVMITPSEIPCDNIRSRTSAPVFKKTTKKIRSFTG